ncbi:MAG: hypothetical protein ACJ764_03875 [Solirubrobacteraceae bacterium]
MLVPLAADASSVISRALVACAFICCFLVLGSFALFALGQASGASKHQVAELNSHSAAAPAVVHPPGQPRRFIDGAARALTSPFRSFIHSSSQWAIMLGSTLCALLLYGLGLGYLARWART